MIAILIYSQSTLVGMIDEFPAPSYVAQSVTHHHSEPEYRALIAKSKNLAANIRNSSLAEILQAVRLLQKQNKATHRMLRKKFANAGDPMFRSIEITSKMNGVDLTKLDFLLILKSRPPIFHTKSWLCTVYSAQINSKGQFVFFNRPIYPHQFEKFAGAFAEPQAASFEPFMDSEYLQTSKWIDTAFKSKRPPEMTIARLIKKL